jgi:hypothetical protein
MSGGRWNYQQWHIEELAGEQLSPEYRELLMAVAETEHIVDWAECSDTSRESAEQALYDLWVKVFDKLYSF